MSFELPNLPYAKDALEPHISANTLDFHHGKHHAGYVTKLNAAVKGTDMADLTIEEIVKKSEGGVFNLAAQSYNHEFYWNCLSPNGGGEANGTLGKAIVAKWGSFDAFKEEFTKLASTYFGSGWAWLAKNESGELELIGTKDADTPLAHGKTPILTVDVWEHAYYLDYQNKRPDYIAAFWKLVNWDFANKNF
ncbi:MAG: superoxide dismutase [Fe] [Candidatus Cloacimonadota bacterium]|nr:MAG: superoxide dismutase [Fe] [Candidatus Cloacimonadota bacterium]